MKHKKSILIMIISIISMTLISCNSEKEEEISNKEERVIVIGQSMAENMIHFGLDKKVIGVAYLDGSFSKYENEISSLPVISKAWPSKEAILGLQPDIIYSMKSAFNNDVIGTEQFWNQKNIDTISVVNFEDGINKKAYYKDLRLFGNRFKIEKKVEEYIDSLERSIENYKSKVQRENKKRVLFVGSAGRDNYDYYPRNWCMIDEIIDDLGGEFIELSDKYMELSTEAIIKLNPDKIIISEFGNDNSENIVQQFKSKKLFKDINAVKNDEILVVDYTSAIRGGIGLKDLYDDVFKFLWEGEIVADSR